jgi:hypothetical protein
MVRNTRYQTQSHHDISDVWSGTAASFDLYTAGEQQFVGFYDADRRFVVGQRDLGETDWTLQALPGDRRVGWDAHHDVELVVDADGYLHVAGNMHNHPLTYYRTTEPGDVASIERVESMVGRDETSVTYPTFVDGPAEDLFFTYRSGSSGSGDWIVNRYDHEEREWERCFDEPLLVGGAQMNAYPHGPIVGPDGAYHLCWVWRDAPDAQTTHDVEYVRSEDFQEWETSQGEPRTPPFHSGTADLVEAIPPYGGLINGNTKIGFDPAGRVVVSYHKFDADGNTQVYNARAEGDGWAIYETSEWQYRWSFGGRGSIPFEIEIGPVETLADGTLVQTYDHVKYGSGLWVLDDADLTPTAWRSPWYDYPAAQLAVRSSHDDMQVLWAGDSGESQAGTHYALRWEALERNRDRPRDETPQPTTLECFAFDAAHRHG